MNDVAARRGGEVRIGFLDLCPGLDAAIETRQGSRLLQQTNFGPKRCDDWLRMSFDLFKCDQHKQEEFALGSFMRSNGSNDLGERKSAEQAVIVASITGKRRYGLRLRHVVARFALCDVHLANGKRFGASGQSRATLSGAFRDDVDEASLFGKDGQTAIAFAGIFSFENDRPKRLFQALASG